MLSPTWPRQRRRVLSPPRPLIRSRVGVRDKQKSCSVGPKTGVETYAEACVSSCVVRWNVGGRREHVVRNILNMCYSVYKSTEQGLNLSGSWYKDHSHAYNTPFLI